LVMQFILLKIGVFLSFASQWLPYLFIVITFFFFFLFLCWALSIIIFTIFLPLSYFSILVLFPKRIIFEIFNIPYKNFNFFFQGTKFCEGKKKKFKYWGIFFIQHENFSKLINN
jgi:hypothetical protein